MRVSVVINTYNRGPSLRNTLLALRYQTSNDFEVIVVNGPSTDSTDEVLAEFADSIRIYKCPEVHLSKSRNIGIVHAAGDIIAFIDDDAIPEPDWISGLLAGYDEPEIGGVGGLVYDHTGSNYQYEYSVCSRTAVPRFDVKPPFDIYNRPGSDPFQYLQGTNCSFRRQVLVEIGGFNEEIEYYLDETEVCMRTIDHGYQLRSLAGAAVHHKYLPSSIRNHQRVVLDPFSTVKNHCTFAVRNGTRTQNISDVLAQVSAYVNSVKAGGVANRDAGRMTDAQLSRFLQRTEQAVDVGLRQGLTKSRPFRQLPQADPSQFLPFPTLRPSGDVMRVCFVTREYPPDRGGIGRFSFDLATGYAKQGHHIHVVTHGVETHTVDFEQGVWVHRIPDVAPKGDLFDKLPLRYNYHHIANVYHEVNRIFTKCGGLDLVSAPIWLCEGMLCQLDNRWPTVVSLHTTMKTIAKMGGTNSDPNHVREIIALEAATLRESEFVYANSMASLAMAQEDSGGQLGVPMIVPHGTADFRDRFPRTRPDDGKFRVLFVGRIETRKGVDVLLDAAYQLLPEFANLEFVFVGKRNPSGGDVALDKFDRWGAANPNLAARVIFTGDVDDQQLMQHYADCDLFVLPSRYESFGLVLTEAMAFGKAVIASRAGGMTEIVEDGSNGYLANVGDAASFAAAIRKLVQTPELLNEFGRRSRQLYDERYSTAMMVENTITAHREMILQWKQKKPNAEPLADRLKKLIVEVSQVSNSVAAQLTTTLLSPRFRLPIDYTHAVTQLWQLPDQDFVCAMYELILRRPADAGGLKWQLAELQRGGSRVRLLEALVHSEEARRLQVDSKWLDDFTPPTPAEATQPLDVTQSGLHSVFKQTREKVMATPGVGKALRLLKRAVVMPRTAQQTHEQTVQLTQAINQLRTALEGNQGPAVQQIRDMVRQITEGLSTLESKTQARDRQVQWVLTQQAKLLEELLSERATRTRGNAAA